MSKLTYKEIRMFLEEELVGSCTCLTKSPVVGQHRVTCKYRLVSAAIWEIDTLMKVEGILTRDYTLEDLLSV